MTWHIRGWQGWPQQTLKPYRITKQNKTKNKTRNNVLHRHHYHRGVFLLLLLLLFELLFRFCKNINARQMCIIFFKWRIMDEAFFFFFHSRIVELINGTTAARVNYRKINSCRMANEHSVDGLRFDGKSANCMSICESGFRFILTSTSMIHIVSIFAFCYFTRKRNTLERRIRWRIDSRVYIVWTSENKTSNVD